LCGGSVVAKSVDGGGCGGCGGFLKLKVTFLGNCDRNVFE
jgi:hypothetical protein